jgi:hypothetical protein
MLGSIHLQYRAIDAMVNLRGDDQIEALSTDPEGARDEGYHGAPEPRFLALGRDSLVDALTQPDVGLHVP